jgi:hypothetical protein
MSFEPPRDQTYMMDSLFVRNQRFDKTIDMSRDPTMYPFTKDNYILEFYYNPRSAPHHIQDKFGWNGEGMTDRTASNIRTDIRPGQRVFYYSIPFTRDELLLRKDSRGKTVTKKSDSYRETKEDYSNTDTGKPDLPGQGGQ